MKSVLAMLVFFLGASLASAQQADIAAKAQQVLAKHCFECHGKNPKKLKGALNVFDRSHLDDKERKIVVAKAPKESELIVRIEDGSMPPAGDRPKVTDEEKKILTDWIAAGTPAFPPKEATAEDKKLALETAGIVKEIFRAHCLECHGGAKKQAGMDIFDHDMLLKKRKIVVGKPEESAVYQVLTATDESAMPPTGQPRLSNDEIGLVRQWIAEGATKFPIDVAAPVETKKEPTFKQVAGVEYVHKKILENVRVTPADERRFKRYFSINHILTAGATEAELEVHREALAKAINHLSWESRIVFPKAIDEPVKTVFVVDLRDVGWNQQPYDRWQYGKKAGKSHVNLFDLALLDYPYGILYEDSDTYDQLMLEFMMPSGMVRPIPFVRADWFCSIILQPPFYEDFLLLPHDVQELERKLGVDADANLRDYVAKRAGMTVSGVSRNNRVVERHPMRAVNGAYWKSFDFRSSKGTENMFRDPIHFGFSGGEMVFNLPNGLQGYYVADTQGTRLDAAPTDIVTDKFAEDKIVRNGLACIRCHDRGIKEFADNVRPAILNLPGSPGFDKRQVLQMYPEQKVMDDFIKEDRDRFAAAMTKLLGKPQTREPLVPVSRRFLEDPLHLGTAAGELGLNDTAGLKELFRSRQFAALGLVPLSAQGVIRRDSWEDYYDAVIRGLGLGVPIVPLDGVARRDYPSTNEPFEIEMKSNKKHNFFEPGEELVVTVTNKSGKTVWVELIGTSARGKKVILTPTPTPVQPGQSYRYPPTGGLKIRGGLGKEQITLFASQREFTGGEVLRGHGVTDRVIHPLYQTQREATRWKLSMDATEMVKRTIEIETK